jgi:hypothetical protein
MTTGPISELSRRITPVREKWHIYLYLLIDPASVNSPPPTPSPHTKGFHTHTLRRSQSRHANLIRDSIDTIRAEPPPLSYGPIKHHTSYRIDVRRPIPSPDHPRVRPNMHPGSCLLMRPTQRLLTNASNSHTHGMFKKLRQMKYYAPQETYPLFFVCGMVVTIMFATAAFKWKKDMNLRKTRQNRRD